MRFMHRFHSIAKPTPRHGGGGDKILDWSSPVPRDAQLLGWRSPTSAVTLWHVGQSFCRLGCCCADRFLLTTKTRI